MEGGIDADTPLDYASFQISPVQNRYEAYACCEGTTEKLATGLLEHLVLHLSPDKVSLSSGSNNNFRLELPEEFAGSHWFTKSTLSRFLHIVGAPELFKNVNGLLDELSQLEEGINFHLALYTRSSQNPSPDETTDNINSKGTGKMQNPRTMEGSSDATKNELLRAMDVRLTTLKEELASSIAQTAGAPCSIKQIIDLGEFSGHFGAMSLRNSLLKCSSLFPKEQASHLEYERSYHSGNMSQVGGPVYSVEPGELFESPAKVAREENRSPIESEESSNSSEEDQSRADRSRALVRSASPRRSASPMRRVQIGRSGSHRSTALTIKSLSYFPAREKISSYRAAVGDSSEDEETKLPEKTPESNPVRRMSVQDAISLFESKRKDQKSDFQRLRTSADCSVSTTNRSVLRRWSAGMGESSMPCGPENSSQDDSGLIVANLGQDQIHDNTVEESKFDDESLGSTEVTEPKAMETKEVDNQVEPFTTEQTIEPTTDKQEVSNSGTNSAEWTRKKEAELNQMLMKMMEAKPNRYQITTVAPKKIEKKESSSERKGNFYDHYKEKRDEKLRGENAGRKAEKDAQFKAMREMLDQRKAEMASKHMGSSGKRESVAQLQKARRNSLPSVGGKKETPSKPVVSRKASPKSSSPLPATRNSWPSTPSPRSIAPSPTKTSGGALTTGSTPTRRKTPPAPPSVQQAPKAERLKSQQKVTKLPQAEMKRTTKVQDQKKQPTATKTEKSTKSKLSMTSTDDSVSSPAKPSFYNKVTKKGSVVPLETKPFLRKGAGIGPSGAASVKTKTYQSDESSKRSGNQVHVQEGVITETAGAEMQVPEEHLVPLEPEKLLLEVSESAEQICERIEDAHPAAPEANENFEKIEDFSDEIQPDEESGISSSAWVEADLPSELAQSKAELRLSQIVIPGDIAPASVCSPRVRHSLSQMLQAESCEPDIVEWGNAENPPALIYQKDSPKGFKRLLKFARKSKGETNSVGWASPSVFSEGEEDAEESKGVSKRSADALRKSTLQAKGFGHQKTMLGESYDEILAAQSNVSNFLSHNSMKMRDGHGSSGVVSSKGSRSFFSLSTFRSGKSSETKLR